MNIAPLSSGSPAPLVPMAPASVRQAASPEMWPSAAAAEELTFQFSENVEASKKREEEQLASVMEPTKADVSVKQVSSILRLMEGNAVFDRLRMQANVFANAFAKDPEGAWQLLSLGTFEPSQRYTAMLLTLDALEKSGNTAAASVFKTQTSEVAAPPSLSTLFQQVSPSEKKASSPSAFQAGVQDSVQDGFYSLISAKPSLDSVLETANQLNTQDDFEKTLNHLQMTLSSSLSKDQLTHIGSTVMVYRLIGVVRTMMALTADILQKVGIRDAHNTPASLKHTQSLIKLAASSAPSSLLDKLATTVLASQRNCPKCRNKSRFNCPQCQRRLADCRCELPASPCTCPDSKAFFFSLLYQQMLLWPEAIWTAAEGNKVLREQLVRKQRSMNDIYRILSR